MQTDLNSPEKNGYRSMLKKHRLSHSQKELALSRPRLEDIEDSSKTTL